MKRERALLMNKMTLEKLTKAELINVVDYLLWLYSYDREEEKARILVEVSSERKKRRKVIY